MIKKLTANKKEGREVRERTANDACSSICISGCNPADPRITLSVEIRIGY